MQLSDLLAESAHAGHPGQRPATSADQTDGAAPFAAMVLEALRASGGDIAPELNSEMTVTDLSLASSPIVAEVDAEVGKDVGLSSSEISAAAGEPDIADGSASVASTMAETVSGRITNTTVVALGISGDATGRPHIESRHVASEAADVVLGELRSMFETSEPVETASPSTRSDSDTSIATEASPATSTPRSASSMRLPETPDAVEITTKASGEEAGNESVDLSTENVDTKPSSELPDRPIDGLAPNVARTDAQSRAIPTNDAGRANASSFSASSFGASAVNASSPVASSANASSVVPDNVATVTAASGAEWVVAEPRQELDSSNTPNRAAPEVISITRSANRQAAQVESEEDVPSAPTEKRDARGKAVRPETASATEREAISAEFRAMAASRENGQPIAATSEEFFETENVSVEEVSQAALPDGPIQEAADDPRLVEGRAIPSADFQSDRAQASREVTMPRAVVSAAWLRAMMEQGLRIHNEPEGWNSVTMRLGDEDGTMTVRTRREDGTMAVQVAFSDSNLRMTAVQNVERLEAALRAQYDTAIDLSLSDSDTRPDDEDHRPSAPNRSRTPIATDHETRDITRRSPWARNEWVV